MAIAPPEPVMDDVPIPEEVDPPSREANTPEEAYLLAWGEYIKQNHNRAIGRNDLWHKRMRRHLMKYQGEWGEYADTETRLFRPMIAKFIHTLNANLVPELVSSPFTMDWLEVESHAPGLEKYSIDIQANQRKKFAGMTCGADEHFLGFVDMSATDLQRFGTTLSTPKFELITGDEDGDGHIETQPDLERLEVFDCYPWSVNVGSPAMTAWTVWTPVSDDELDKIVDDPVLREQIRKFETKSRQSEDLENGPERRLSRDRFPDVESPEHMFPGVIYYGGAPFRAIMEFAPSEWRERLLKAGPDAMYLALGQKFGFGNSEEDIKDVRWWRCRMIGDRLVEVKPYPFKLPRGEGPIILERYVRVPGQIWGLGLYDIVGQDELCHNEMNTAMIHLSMMAAQPPTKERKGMIDEAWAQQNGGEGKWKMKPGTRVQIKQNAAVDGEILEVIDYPYDALPTVERLSASFEIQARELGGVSSDMEGNSKARTATQNVNNVQFGLAARDYLALRLRAGAMLSWAKRIYLLTQQGMRLMSDMVEGFHEQAPLTHADRRIRTSMVTADHLPGISWLTFSVAGPNNEASRVTRLQTKAEGIRLFQVYPGFNMKHAVLDYYKDSGDPNYQKFLIENDQLTQMEQFQNLLAVFKQPGNIPAEYMMAIGLPPLAPQGAMMGPGAAPEAAPMGNPNIQGAPEGIEVPASPFETTPAGAKREML